MGLFRMSDWWRSKAALLMGIVYLFVFWFDIGFEKFLALALLSVFTISGFASFGYLLNDFFDREKDTKAGKKNFLAGKSSLQIAPLFAVSLSFLLVPWMYLPLDLFSAGLIVSEILLFFIYSMPPLRLKEKGLTGIITDSFYAHALPVILACHTFSLAAGQPLPVFPAVLLFVWQSLYGIRNILLHQENDLDADRAAGARNFVAGIYPQPFRKAISYLIISETAASLVFFGMLVLVQPLMTLLPTTIIILSAVFFVKYNKAGMDHALPPRWRYFPNGVFEEWTPPVLLIALTSVDTRFALILPLHLLAFNINFFVQLSNRVIRPAWSATRSSLHLAFINVKDAFLVTLSFTVNRLIYYGFLLFGVDLKKENTSALGYIKKVRKTKAK